MASYDVADPEGGAASRRPGRSAPSKSQPKGALHWAQPPGPEGKSKKDDSETLAGSELEAMGEEEKEAIRKRAEGRTKVPPRFRDSIKRFFFSPTGMLKVLRMGLLVAALTCFIIAEAPESFIAITILEIFIVILFILIYMLTLHHLLTYIHWPLLDLINSFITTVFLVVVAIMTLKEKERRHLFYVGGALCLAAAVACLMDATLVTKLVRRAMKKVLGLEGEAAAGPPAKEEPERQPKAEPEKALSPVPSEPAAAAAGPSP